MRWENLRDDVTSQSMLPIEVVAPTPDRGSGRAGLGTPAAAPIASDDGEPIAIEIRARSIINRVPGESRVPFRWTINPYRGCGHACRYCFARQTHTYLDLDAGHDFDSKIMVKVNAGALVRRELTDPRWAGEPIAMGTNTDPYQRAEGRYRLMREIVAALRDAANPFSILTKGTLILRDLGLIADAARRAAVSIAVSVGCTDEALWRAVEPGAPSPRRRLEVIERFAAAGIEGSVLMAPILPGLSDDDEHIDRTIATIAAAGARSVTPLPLHLRPGAREWYRDWLRAEHPDLLPLYGRLYGRGSYAPAHYQRDVIARVQGAARRYGLGPVGPATSRRLPAQRSTPL
ncbi:MAG: Rv2578c family radical SAM protein [Mycobacteriales bacterium]|nr:MAG: radical SAM protein [Pseudonocardiales bacterium]